MTDHQSSLMASEISEIPGMLSRQIDQVEDYIKVGRELRDNGIRGIVTCARGTSDHAATHFKYLMETQTGIPVASIGPSVASIYRSELQLGGFASIAFSQSGQSPDLTLLQDVFKAGGAKTIAILNTTSSPLAYNADKVLPVLAGPECAVAATKSFIGMLFASVAIVAGYTDDYELHAAFDALPDLAAQALESDWSEMALPLVRSGSLYCVSRGPGLAIASEASLKFKETCRLHAEAYSSAEIHHGPISIVNEGFAALFFCTQGNAEDSIKKAINALKKRGARIFFSDTQIPKNKHKKLLSHHIVFDPILEAIAFYKFVEKLACDLGENPDAPSGLNKITTTV